MKRLMLFAVAAAAALGLSANAWASSPNVVDVKTSARGGVLTAPELRVTVRSRTQVRSFSASLDAADVSSQFRVQGHGIRVARLSVTALDPGVHHLYVETTGANGKQDFDTARFVAGRPSESLLSERPLLGAAGGSVVQSVDVSEPDDALRAWLNGRSVSGAFDEPGAVRRTARLGANDGLRFGENELRVVAFNSDGVYDVDTTRFTVPRTHPLAGAGPDRLGAVGGGIRLDGTSSLPTRRGAGLDYSWRIVSRPPGSKARLHGPHAAKPLFYPDVKGRYRIQLTVSQGGASGTDVVTADTTPPDPPIGVRIDMLGPNGQVVIDGKPVANTGGGAGRISLVVLSRYDRSEQTKGSYPATRAGVADLKTALNPGDQGYQKLVIVSGSGVQADAASDLGAVLATIGASFSDDDRAKIGAGKPFSVVGVPGSDAGSAYTNIGTGPTPGDLSGYLQVNLSNPATTQYGFVFQEFVTFSTHKYIDAEGSDANVITVGDKQYQSGPFLADGGESGFQVVVLDGGTLALKANRTFKTSTVYAGPDEQNQQAMASFLSQVAPGDVVLVQAISSATQFGASPYPAWNDIATQLETLGGNRAVFNSLPIQYALAGTRRPVEPGVATGVEAYSTKDDDTGATGFLVRNHRSLFEPEAADITPGFPNRDLVKYAYQPAQEWPDSKTPGQKAANDWFARQLHLLGRCGDPKDLCDMRAQYYLNFNAAWGSILTQLQGLKYPKGVQFSQGDFKTMKQDFVRELPQVDRVTRYIKDLQEPLNRAEGRGHVDLGEIAKAIQADLQIPAGDPTVSNTLNLIGLAASAASGVPEVGPAFTALSGALAVAGYLTMPNGGGVWATIDAKVSEVSDQLTARFDAFHGQVVQLGRIIVSDPDKLQALYEKVNTDGWRLEDVSYARILGTLTKTDRAWLMTALMPAPWALWRLETYGVVLGNVRNWWCWLPDPIGGDEDDFYVFSDASDSGQENHTIKFVQGVPYPQWSLLAPQNIDWGNVTAHTPVPSATLTDPLFQPIDSPSPKALGLNKWYFYSPFVFTTKTAISFEDDCRKDGPPPPPPR